MPAVVFRVETGAFALALVDTEAVGYDDAWQAPGGDTAATAQLSDYATGGGTFTCQVVSGALTASANTSEEETPATFCQPAVTTTIVGVTSYSLDIELLQDPNVEAGISRYLFENDTLEAYFYLGLNSESPPTAIGRCRIVAGQIGGAARTQLTATVSLPVSRKPDIEFGTPGDSTIVAGDGTITPVVLAASASSSSSVPSETAA